MVLAACSGSSAPVDTVPFETCPYSVAAWCASWPAGCPMTWTEARDPSRCSALRLFDCGENHVARSNGVDAPVDFEYDASGALYRVDYFGFIGHTTPDPCSAGAGPQIVVTDRCKQVTCP